MSFLRRRTLLLGLPLAAAFACGYSIQSLALFADEPADAAATASADIIKTDDADEKPPAEEAEPSDAAPTYGAPVITRMRCGARVEAKGGDVQNVFIMVAVPLDCPEQEVRVVDEEVENVGSVEFRMLPEIKLSEPGARQMLITIPNLPARQTAIAAVTYEISTKQVHAPRKTADLRIPTKPAKQLKPFLSSSPLIPVDDRKIKTAVDDALALRVERGAAGSTLLRVDGQPMTLTGGVADAGSEAASAAFVKPSTAKKDEDQETEDPASAADDQTETGDKKLSAAEKRAIAKEEAETLAAEIEKLTDWQRVEALYDFVREKMKYLDGAPDMSAIQVLKDEKADCHGLSALFVAMCRTMNVPARMVWVDNHQYAEFYLEDKESGKGYWYPAQLAGTRAFGEMPTPIVVFQKGDNFRVPERRRERLRYATDHTTLQASSKHKPRVVYIREPL